jgi:hypothetical protein
MRNFLSRFTFKRSPVDWASLNVRLTIEASLLVIVGLGSVALWTGLKMQQILLTSHTQNIGYIADRLPRDVATYSEMMPIGAAIQKTIDTGSPNLGQGPRRTIHWPINRL